MTRKLMAGWLRDEIDEFLAVARTGRFYYTLLATAVGCSVYSAAINGIIIPHHLFSPGVTGISLIWFYLVGVPSVGVMYALLNIPLFVLGWREYALRYVILSMIGVGLFTIALEATRDIRLEVADPIMAALLAGLLTGAGTGMYLRMGGSAGGLDIFGSYIKKKFGISIGTTVIAVNGMNLLGAALIEDLDNVLFSAVFMWVNSWTMDKVQTGFSQGRAVLIVTSRPYQVAGQLTQRLDRGFTFVHAMGGYSGAETDMIYTVINMLELGKLKDVLFEIDESAFITVLSTSEVIGTGFVSWERQGYRRPRSSPVKT